MPRLTRQRSKNSQSTRPTSISIRTNPASWTKLFALTVQEVPPSYNILKISTQFFKLRANSLKIGTWTISVQKRRLNTRKSCTTRQESLPGRQKLDRKMESIKQDKHRQVKLKVHNKKLKMVRHLKKDHHQAIVARNQLAWIRPLKTAGIMSTVP